MRENIDDIRRLRFKPPPHLETLVAQAVHQAIRTFVFHGVDTYIEYIDHARVRVKLPPQEHILEHVLLFLDNINGNTYYLTVRFFSKRTAINPLGEECFNYDDLQKELPCVVQLPNTKRFWKRPIAMMCAAVASGVLIVLGCRYSDTIMDYMRSVRQECFELNQKDAPSQPPKFKEDE